MNRQLVRPALLLMALALTGLFLDSGQAQDKATKPPQLPAKDWKGAVAYRVLRVIDADTIEVEQDDKPVKVRLIGVSTPKTVHPTKAVQAYGKEASRFATNLLKGESVYLEYDWPKRTLAYVYRAPDGLFVNLEMIRQGYRAAYLKHPLEPVYGEAFRYHERQAREAERGLWGAAEAVATKGTPPGKETPPAKIGGTKTEGSGEREATVYVTKTGGKYHREGCKVIAKSKGKKAVSLKEAKNKYGPCTVCKPPK